jgi:hypothetical protein
MRKILLWRAILGAMLFLGGVTAASAANISYGVILDPPPGTVISSWLGNTLSGANGQWVQNFIKRIQVQSDGSVYAWSAWDEAGQNMTIYKNGAVSGTFDNDFDVYSVRDNNGNTWSIENIKWAGGTGVKNASGVSLPDAGTPVALSLANDGKIIVTDNGPDQQIKFYDVSNANSPVLASTFGVKGGYLANDPKGKLGSLHFAGPRGCGTDAQGNIYVAGQHPGSVGGSWISAHKPDGTVLWRMIGECFLDMTAVDPASDGIDIYSEALHYKMDYTQPEGKEQGDFPYAVTTDPFSNPDDSRLNVYDGGNYLKYNEGTAGAQHCWGSIYGMTGIVNYRGTKYIFGTSQNGPGLYGMKFTGPEQATMPIPIPELHDDCWGVWVDDSGGVWVAHQYGPNGIWYYPCTGKDAADNLTWGTVQKWAYPPEANVDLGTRIFYEVENDVLYFAAYPTDARRVFGWGDSGNRIYRYDGWLKGSKTLHSGYPIVLPSTANDGDNSSDTYSIVAQGIAWAGEYIFVCYAGLGPRNDPNGNATEVSIWNAQTCESVGTMDVGSKLAPADGHNYGWTDIVNPLSAFKRSNGEYIVLMEEDYKNKNLLYRWCPSGSCSQVKLSDDNTHAPQGTKVPKILVRGSSLSCDFSQFSPWTIRISTLSGQNLRVQKGNGTHADLSLDRLARGWYVASVENRDRGNIAVRFGIWH